MNKELFDTVTGIFQDISTFLIEVVLGFFGAIFDLIF